MSLGKNILILGSGGREHALALRLSKECEQLFVFPGNAGMDLDSSITCLNGNLNNHQSILDIIQEKDISFVIVGPEQPLAEGIVDFLTENNILTLGPTKAAAQLESSKVFSKNFMLECRIPTADYKVFDEFEMAIADLKSNDNWNDGVVIKASSLAAGKGVFVCDNKEEAERSIFNIMKNDLFGVTSKEIVMEQLLIGREVSAFALCDGKNFKLLGYACDHKRLLNNDEGPNTGGMGTFSPVSWMTEELSQKIQNRVIKPVLQGMQNRGTTFKGILFAGLMIKDDDVNVIEYNVRLGDPETQVLLPLLEGPLLDNFISAASGNLNFEKESSLRLKHDVAIHVVKSSQGYPALNKEPMKLNQEITIDRNFFKENCDKYEVIFSGVKSENGKLINSGGRVLGITGLGESLAEARFNLYQNIDKINFEGAHWRDDIGKV